MANYQQLELLKKGAASWNEWREQNQDVDLDFHAAELRCLDLRLANLDGADLSNAVLSGSDLSEARLSYANLCDAVLAADSTPHSDTVNLSGADLTRAALVNADLSGANMARVTLAGAELTGAKLIRVDLGRANLTAAILRCDLSFTNLSHANLDGTDLSGANLTNARLNGANLTGANLSHVILNGADLAEATMGDTILANVDLSAASGLERVHHKSNSCIGLDTLYRSQGRIPDEFLRSAGVPEEVLEHLIARIRNASRWRAEGLR